jgi:hypothetical protein
MGMSHKFNVTFTATGIGKRQHVMTTGNKEEIKAKLAKVYPGKKIALIEVRRMGSDRPIFVTEDET